MADRKMQIGDVVRLPSSSHWRQGHYMTVVGIKESSTRSAPTVVSTGEGNLITVAWVSEEGLIQEYTCVEGALRFVYKEGYKG